MVSEQLQRFLTIANFKTTGDAGSPGADLWQYAVNKYAEQPIADLCMTLQNLHRFDTNCLLYAGWLASRHISLPLWQQWQEACELSMAWQLDVVEPLRRIRQLVPSADAVGLADIRGSAASLELACERRQLEVLAALEPPGDSIVTAADQWSPDNRCSISAIRRNLFACMSCATVLQGTRTYSLAPDSGQIATYGQQLAVLLASPSAGETTCSSGSSDC